MLASTVLRAPYWSARVNVPTDKGYVLWISICFGYSDLEHFPVIPKYLPYTALPRGVEFLHPRNFHTAA